MTVIAATIDFRGTLGAIRDQGPRPTCLAFAVSDAHAAARGGCAKLSCEFIFFHAQRRAGRPPTKGALFSSMLDALDNDGQPEESGWPYLETTPQDLAAWHPPYEVGPVFGRNSAKITPTTDQIIQEVSSGTPIIVLTKLSQSFFSPTRDGVVDPAVNEQPESSRRHAVVAVGHGTVGSQRAILVRNSWGPRWGDGGYAWLTERFLVPRIFAAAKLTDEADV